MHQDSVVVLALVPKLSGCISIVCSLYILREIRIDRRSGRLPITPITRAVAAMSVWVLILGLTWSASNWMVPAADDIPAPAAAVPTPLTATAANAAADTSSEDGFFAWLAAPTGNRSTCRLQGFLLQLAIAPPLYNAAILWFAQLSIVYHWSNERIARYVEIPTHCAIIIWCVCSATWLLLHDKYHSVGPVCWASDPPECYNDDNNNNNTTTKIDNDDDDDDATMLGDGSSGIHHHSTVSCNIKLYSTILYCIPLWLALIYTIVSCGRINYHVHRHLSTQKHITQRADSLVVLYSCAIFITYTPCIIWSFTFWQDDQSDTLTLLFGLLEPLQGVWNLAIFLMNRRPATRARLRQMLGVQLCGRCGCWGGSCSSCWGIRKSTTTGSSSDPSSHEDDDDDDSTTSRHDDDAAADDDDDTHCPSPNIHHLHHHHSSGVPPSPPLSSLRPEMALSIESNA
jgi:hypothetical protein